MDGSSANRETPYANLTRDELEAQITELSGHLNAATHRWLTLIAEFDDRNAWSDGSLASCAHWLNFKVGLNLGAAREKLRVAHALPGVPKISAAMARGELSYSKVRALTRVATPATEDTLLLIALHGTAYHVETVVRSFRRAMEAQELSREARQQAGRTVDFWYDEDGSLVLKARLPALAGAQLVKALEIALDDVPQSDLNAELAAERRLTPQARRADALALIAETYLQRGAWASAMGGVAAGSDAAKAGTAGHSAERHQGAARHQTADRFQVVVHVDADVLKDRGAGRCEVEEGPSIAVETVRRLTCDASLVRITETEAGEPLDVGRKTRTIPPAIRRALNTRDAGCCFPGCTSTRYLDAHHIEHWAEGGETKLSNLVTLCRRHHRAVHEGGITLAAKAGGGFGFKRSDGSEFDTVRPMTPTAYEWDLLHDAHEAAGLEIDADTAATRWRGERMDFELGVSVLCQEENRSRGLNEVGQAVEGTPDVDVPPDVSAEISAAPDDTAALDDATSPDVSENPDVPAAPNVSAETFTDLGASVESSESLEPREAEVDEDFDYEGDAENSFSEEECKLERRSKVKKV